MILLGLGSNLPWGEASPQQILTDATAAIDAFAPVLAASRRWTSPAWPDPSDPPFVNMALRVRSGEHPRALLRLLHKVEAQFGRVRSAKNAPRTLDIDLLDYDGLILEAACDGLDLPHPRMAERAFVLGPLADIAPRWRHPTLGRTAAELLGAAGARAAQPLGR